MPFVMPEMKPTHVGAAAVHTVGPGAASPKLAVHDVTTAGFVGAAVGAAEGAAVGAEVGVVHSPQETPLTKPTHVGDATGHTKAPVPTPKSCEHWYSPHVPHWTFGVKPMQLGLSGLQVLPVGVAPKLVSHCATTANVGAAVGAGVVRSAAEGAADGAADGAPLGAAEGAAVGAGVKLIGGGTTTTALVGVATGVVRKKPRKEAPSPLVIWVLTAVTAVSAADSEVVVMSALTLMEAASTVSVMAEGMTPATVASCVL